MQETLDVYLWLTSGHSSVEKAIGVSPTKIIIVADSAGAHLAFGLIMVLNDIQKIKKHISNEVNNNNFEATYLSSNILMPQALFGIFPLLNMDVKVSPSLLLATIELIISMPLAWESIKGFVLGVDEDYGLERETRLASGYYNSLLQFINSIKSLLNFSFNFFCRYERSNFEKLFQNESFET